jgi:hypothetical protein
LEISHAAKAACETDEAEDGLPPPIGGRPRTISQYDGRHPSTRREPRMGLALIGSIKLAQDLILTVSDFRR